MQGKIAFLYPGQGSQKVGMGHDFYMKYKCAKSLFDEADALLDFDLLSTCFSENNKLNETSYTQPALVVTSLAITRCLKEQGMEPDITAGLSLGEYSAIAVSGGMAELDAIRLVRERGLFMEDAVPKGEGGMAAVLGLDKEQIENVIKGMDGVWIANYNCPGQIVITGKDVAVKEAARQLKEAGAKRVMELKVSGPFHSPLMEQAARRLEKKLLFTTIDTLRVPYVANVSAEVVCENKKIIPLLTWQVSNSVLWEQSVRTMLAEGVNTFVEIGPGRTLSNFVKKINSNVITYPVGTVQEMERVVGELVCRENK